MSDYPIVRCGACQQVNDVDPRDLDALNAHHRTCPAEPYWSRGYTAGQREALTDVRLHGNPDAPERAILVDLITRLRRHCGDTCRCDIAQAADRAERHLREIDGPSPSMNSVPNAGQRKECGRQ